MRKAMRAVALVATAALVAGAFFAVPAEAAKKKKKAIKCSAFTPGVEDAGEAKLLKVTSKNTEKKPAVVEFEHGPALSPVQTEDFYVNIQVAAPAQGLYIHEEFADRHDIDLYLFDAAGEEVASSGAFNPAPVPGVTDAGGNGGTNYESIPGFAVDQCAGFTINSHAYATYGTPATIHVWLGKAQAAE
jgi:hypothetical protein